MFKKFKTMSKEKEINIEDGNVQETVQNEIMSRQLKMKILRKIRILTTRQKKVTTIQTLLTRRQKRLILNKSTARGRGTQETVAL